MEIANIGVQLLNVTQQLVVAEKRNISQIKVLPSLLQNFSVEAILKDFKVAPIQKMWLLLKFTLPNEVGVGAMVQIEVPAKVQLQDSVYFGESQTVVLDKGFDSSFRSNQLKIQYVTHLNKNQYFISL